MKFNKWVCDSCGAVLTESELSTYKDPVGEWHGQTAYEERSCCPCGSDDIYEVEAVECDKCGEEIEGAYYEFDDMQICPACMEQYKKCYPQGKKCDVCGCLAPIGYEIDGQWHCLECIEIFKEEVKE